MNNLALLIAILLTIGTVFVRYQIYKKTTQERRKNLQRLTGWWLIFGVCLPCFYLGLEAITALVFILIVWSGIELSQIVQHHFTNKQSLAILSLTTTLGASIFFISGYNNQIIFLGSLLLAFFSYFLSVNLISFIALFWLSCCFSLSSIVLITVSADSAKLDYGYLLLFLFFMTAVNDIAQYIAGSIFGKTVIAPKLSPKKTLEGLFGGMVVTAFLCAIFLPDILAMSLINALLSGVILSLAGLLGDLRISKLKRATNIKDSASSIIGHGGLFDRMDSMLLIAPVFGLLATAGGYI